MLLITMAAPFLGTYAVLRYEKARVRKEIKRRIIAGIDKKELVSFTFSHNDPRPKWMHAKEFEYQGQMYDVVDAQTIGDSVTYWCWWDHEETSLNQRLKQLVEQALGQSPQKKENQKRLFHFLDTLFHQPVASWMPFALPVSKKIDISYQEQFAWIDGVPNAPPPEQV